jgi:hypothetical protein
MFIHHVYACKRARVRARAWLKHSLIFGRILFKFAGHILQMTTSYMGYIRIMFTHRAHMHERAWASAHVIKCSLIYGRFLLKFAVNILQLTISSKGYVLFMFTPCSCVSARVVTHSIIFARNLFKFDGHILQMTTSYTACTRVRACVYEHTTDPQRLHEPYNLCMNACLNSAHQYIFTNLPSP